jgi:hypothetical protein
MITAKVSVTKKRPSTEQYSSDSFSATLEVELPDAAFINGNSDLREALSKLFKEVDAQVDDQINGKNGKNTPHIDENTPARPQEPNSPAERTGDTSRTPEGASEASQRRRPKGPRSSNGKGSGTGGNGNVELATNKQVNFMIGLAQREAKMSLPELRAFCKREVKKDDIYSLSKNEASAVIDLLKNGG